MRKIILLSSVLFLIAGAANSQIAVDKAAVGLSFVQAVRINGVSDTGNPGMNLMTWISLDKRKNMRIVPSITALRPHSEKPESYYITTSYVFHGDLDFQYRFFQEKTISVLAFTGMNYTYLMYNVNMLISMPDAPEEAWAMGIGPNIGAGLEMRMGAQWDMNLGAKYTFSGLAYETGTTSVLDSDRLGILVIQLHAVYYFQSRSHGFRRRY